ncbi:MAG: hypothetical protein GY754_19805, partial [bacterium]|nr:hypothetical protein [bacterium]
MNKKNFVSKWTLVMGVLFVLLGIAHNAAAPFVMREYYAGKLSGDDLYTFLFMFAATGIAVLFAGILTVYAARGLKKSKRWAWVCAFGSGLYILILGIGAIITLVVLTPEFNPQAYVT